VVVRIASKNGRGVSGPKFPMIEGFQLKGRLSNLKKC
jgi:hypothetical protein